MEVIHQYKVTEDSVTIYDETGNTKLAVVRHDGFEIVSDKDKLSCQFKPQMATQVGVLRLLNEAFAIKVFLALHLLDVEKPEFQQIIDIEGLLDNEVWRTHGYITRGALACPNTVFFFHKDNPKTIFYLYSDVGEYHLRVLKDNVLYTVETKHDAEYFGNRHFHDIAERLLEEHRQWIKEF